MLLAFVFTLGLTGCKEDPECSQDVPCPFGATCVQGICQEKRCATSDQCAMEHYCAEGACVTGCEEDSDCYPGDICNTDLLTCETGGCEDAHRDCGFKEFCNAASGECYEAAGYYCKSCSSNEDCGGAGNYCTSYGFCGVDCNSNSDCPAGFDCAGFIDANGNIQYYQCFTYCWLYEDYEGEMPTSKQKVIFSKGFDPRAH